MISFFYTIFDSQLSNGGLQSLLSILPRKDQDRIRRYRRWQDCQVHLAGRLLLRKGLIENGFSSNILDSLKFNAYGKPYINDNIEFSISNSGMCSACAITTRTPIGIDVEALNDIDTSGFKSFMNPNEWAIIQDSIDQHETFFKFWTKKEAALKADGRGFSVPSEQVRIKNNSAIVSGKKWHTSEIPFEAPYICHLATETATSNVVIKKIAPSELGPPASQHSIHEPGISKNPNLLST